MCREAADTDLYLIARKQNSQRNKEQDSKTGEDKKKETREGRGRATQALPFCRNNCQEPLMTDDSSPLISRLHMYKHTLTNKRMHS